MRFSRGDGAGEWQSRCKGAGEVQRCKCNADVQQQVQRYGFGGAGVEMQRCRDADVEVQSEVQICCSRFEVLRRQMCPGGGQRCIVCAAEVLKCC